MTVGRAALLPDDGRLHPVWVLATQGARLRVADRRGIERVVAPSRLLWVSDQTLGGAAELDGWWAAVEDRAAECDLAMAWELLADDGSLPAEMSAAALADLTPGGRAAADVDGVVVAVFRDSGWFKLRRGRIQPISAEAVEAARRKAEEEARAARALELAVGALGPALRGSGEGLLVGEEPAAQAAVREYLDALIDLALYGREGGLAGQALELLTELGYSTTKGNLARRAFEMLVRLGEFVPDENLPARRAKVRRRFPAAVVEEAERLAGVDPAPAAGRRDLRGLYTIAIDDERTTEVDDAFAIDGGRLYVFVADAAAWAPPGSALDREAQRRASTLYLPEGKIPMMPEGIGEGAASLLAGVDRLALCFSGVLDEGGQLDDLAIEAAVCRVDQRRTYVEIDALLGAEPAVDEGAEAALVREAAGWMARHREGRRQRGALLLQRKEVEVSVDEQGRVAITPVHANGPARQLVSEMMVAVGVATARWCAARGVPCAYRVQPAPDQDLGLECSEVEDPAEQVRVLRQLKPSGLATRPGLHFTLGVDAYTQVTSPIRRYQDLLMHQQIGAVLRTGAPALAAEEIEEVLARVEPRAGALRRVEHATRRFWTLRFLEQHRELEWEATVIRPLGKRWLVELSALAHQAPLRTARALTPGESLRVRVADVAARSEQLVLREA